MRKLTKYSNGSIAITEGVEVVIHGAEIVLEEDLSYLTDEDFNKLKDNPKGYELKNNKVIKVKVIDKPSQTSATAESGNSLIDLNIQ